MTTAKIIKQVKAKLHILFSVLVALLLVLSNCFFPKGHPIYENIYFSGFYRVFRSIWDGLTGWVPFPVTYLFAAGIAFLLIRSFWQWWHRSVSFLDTLLNLCFGASLLYLWFYISWGLNYNRQDLSDRWGLQEPISERLLTDELVHQTRLLDSLRIQFGEKRFFSGSSEELEQSLRAQLLAWFDQNGFVGYGTPRCRKIIPSGVLLVWSATGMYFPFAGESLFDAGLHALAQPFTMAHELAHGYGWTHEGDCNFIAYLACIDAIDPAIRYSAEFNYWKYLLSNYRNQDPKGFKMFRSTINPQLMNDLEAVRKKHDQYPEFLPAFRAWFYDRYLNYNQVKGGSQSYSDIVRMVIVYKLKRASVNF